MVCSNNGLLSTFTSGVCFLLVLPTCSTKRCGLELTGRMKSTSDVLTNVDMMLCKTACIGDSFVFASCRRSGDEPKKIEKVCTKSCGSKVCNETSQCLEEGCEKVCVKVPPLCDLHTASKTGDLFKVKFILSQGRPNVNCHEWFGRTPVMWAAGEGHREVVELLIGKGAKLSLVDSFGMNILHTACLGGDVELVKHVLSQNVLDINGRVQCMRTAAMLAAETGHKDMIKLLVDKGADVSLVDKRGENILHCACRGGNVEVVEYILSRNMVGIDSLAHRRKTPMMVAGEGGHKEVVELLVKHGANLVLRDSDRNNILHIVCKRGRLDVAKYIVSLNKISINSRGFEKKTPVMEAGHYGHKEVVKFLVNHGAKLAVIDSDTNNILHLISYGGDVDVLRYVLSQNKVDIDRRGWMNRPPVSVAAQQGHKDLVELFVKQGANLLLKDRRSNNFLYYASEQGHLNVVKYIVSLDKISINSRGFEKKTPVMIAGKNGHIEVVKVLVNHGAKLAVIDSDTNNILHLTAYGGFVDVMKYVLSQNSVDVNRRGWKRRTPVMIAGMKGHKGLVELFVKHGAQLSFADREGNNVLLLAVSHVEVVKYILSLGVVNVNVKNKKRESAAMRARARGRQNVLDLLVSHGAHT